MATTMYNSPNTYVLLFLLYCVAIRIKIYPFLGVKLKSIHKLRHTA